MPFNVRIFGYRGIVQAQSIDTRHHTDDSVFFLEEPYLWSQKLTVPDDGNTVMSAPVANLATGIVKIEVDDGFQALLEIQPLSGGNVAGDSSPLVSGDKIIEWGPGYTIAATKYPRSVFFPLVGLNLSGLEDNSGAPSLAEMSYFASRGVSTFRLPLTWLAIQSTAFGALDGSAYLSSLSLAMATAASIGAKLILDIHNFGSGPGNAKIGSAALPISAFVDFWNKFSAWLRADPNYSVIYAYDIMNEWNGMDPNSSLPSTPASQDLIVAANSAVMMALRAVGDNSLLLLEWDHFSGAWDAVTNNIVKLFNLILSDPAQNSRASVHCYLDNDSSGSNFVWAQEIAKPGLAPPGLATNVNIFAQRLASVTALAQSMGITLHCGEMGWSNDSLQAGGNDDYVDWNQAADNALAYCQANNIGITTWAAGPGFGLSYAYNPAPSNVASRLTKDFTSAGLQSTQMVVLEKYAHYAGPQPTAYRADIPYNAVAFAPSGTPIPNFKLRYNGKIPANINFLGSASLPDGSDAGGTFSPLSMPSGNNGIVTFSYTPAGDHKQIRLAFSNSAALTDPPVIGCSSLEDLFTARGIVPINVYGLRLLYYPYAGPAIRLRRVSDAAQMDFYFNNNGDLPRQDIQDWTGSRSISIVTVYDQSLNGLNITYRSGPFATLNLVNSAGYPEIVFPANAEYGFLTSVGTTTVGNLQQTIIARISDGGGFFFISQDNSNGPSSFFPFRFAPSGYNINNNSASVTLGGQVGVYHTYGGTFTANMVNGLVGYKDGSVTTRANTPASGLLSGSTFTSMGYFVFFPASQWTGSWTDLIILTTALDAATMAAFAADDASYYSTPLPDSLSAVAPTIAGAVASGLYTASGQSAPFANVTITDTNPASPTDSVTITLTGAAATLAGAGISGTGPYTIAAASAASVTATLRAAVLSSAASIGSQITCTLSVTSSAGTTANNSATVVTVSAYGVETPFAAPVGSFAPTNYFGVNIAGGENIPPIWSDVFFSQIDYFAGKGFGLIRMPIKMGNLYSGPGSFTPLKTTALGHIKAVLDHCFTKNMYVIIDMHDFGIALLANNSTGTIGVTVGAADALADSFSRLASAFGNYPNVIFGLQNEPGGMSVAQWKTAAQLAIGAIRATGATQKILIPGAANSDGAHDWVTSGNAATWAGYAGDPGNNFWFEMHQYLDSDFSGSHPTATQNGSTVLAAATAWLVTNGFQGFLGEFGFAPDPWRPSVANAMNYDSTRPTIVTNGLTQGANLINYMQANSNQWPGWSYWVAGDFLSQPSQGGYAYSLVFNVADQPQLAPLVAGLVSSGTLLMADGTSHVLQTDGTSRIKL